MLRKKPNAMFIAAALAVSACTAPTITPPVSVAERTTLDEKIALSVELGYQAAGNLALVTGAAKLPAVKSADRKAYAAVQAVRAAYSAGNAASYANAATTAYKALADLTSAIRS